MCSKAGYSDYTLAALAIPLPMLRALKWSFVVTVSAVLWSFGAAEAESGIPICPDGILKDDLSVCPLPTLQQVVIAFNAAESALSDRARDALDDVVELLRQRPNLMLRVSAFPRSNGDNEAREQRVRARITSVAAYLRAKGIESQRISFIASRTPTSSRARSRTNGRSGWVEIDFVPGARSWGSENAAGGGQSAPIRTPELQARSTDQATALASLNAEQKEWEYVRCLDAAAEHYGAVAGQAGRYESGQGDPYTDCAPYLTSWRDALIAANPSGGRSVADAHIEERMKVVSGDVAMRMQEAFQGNNHQ